jgi:hypothetical protein
MSATAKEAPPVSPLVKKLIARAIKELEEAEPTVFMTVNRAAGKARRINPTDTQSRLLRYIETHQPIPFHRTLCFDWRYLGGLLTRKRVTWDGDKLRTVK